MAINLLDLVRKARRVAKQASGIRAGKPESGGLPREVHIVPYCLWKAPLNRCTAADFMGSRLA
jgi:hypothetical protein